MTTLSDLLHDRIDLREELANEAASRTRELVTGRFGEALDATSNLTDALTLLAAWVAADLDIVTTRAVRAGARMQTRIAKRGAAV
jgi:hypothetical protein